MTWYIKTILERGPFTAADLAHELQVTLPEVQAALAAMERRGEVVEVGGFYTLMQFEPAPLPQIYISEEVEGKIWRKRRLRPADVYTCLRDPKAKAREIPPRLSRELVVEILQQQPDWTPSPVVLWVGRGSGGRILSLIILDEDPPILVTALVATKAHIGLVQYEG